MKVFVIVSIVLLVGCATAAPSSQERSIESESGSTFLLASRFLGPCLEEEDMATCLAVKGITALNRAARSSSIDIISGISFKRDPSNEVARNAKALTENEIYAQLPDKNDEKSSRLLDLAMESATDFLGSHNLEVKVPAEATQEVARAFEEGRGKLKKMLGPIAIALGAKLFAVVPLVIGFLALLTFKAVFVAKIAFLLAILVGGSRLLGGIGKGAAGIGGYNSSPAWSSSSNAGWSSGASAAYPYARGLSDEAQDLAYVGQTPAVQ